MVDFYGLCQILQFGLNALMDGVSQEITALGNAKAVLVSEFTKRYRLKRPYIDNMNTVGELTFAEVGKVRIEVDSKLRFI